MNPEGWRSATYGQIMVETGDRADQAIELPVLSVTKTRGPMLASERFGKVMHGRDLKKYRVARRGSVVADPMLLWDGSIGLQTVVDAGLVSPDYRVYRPVDGVDPRFLGYLVRSPMMQPHYQGGARGTNVRRNRIARSDFLRIPLALPPLPEQRKIAAICASMDRGIDATQAVIEQLQIVKKAMMAELLARGLPGRHTEFKQTTIGEVPKSWEVLPIGQLVESCDYGISKSLTVEPRGVAVLRMGNLGDGPVLMNDLKYVSSEEVAPALLLQRGDVLFNRTNSKALVGKVGVFLGSSLKVSFASYLLRLRLKVPHSGEWLGAVMNLDTNQASLRAMATPGVSQVNINRGKMLAMEIPVPPASEQVELVAVLSATDNREAAERDVLEQLSRVRTALMSVLLTGEVRVKPDEGDSKEETSKPIRLLEDDLRPQEREP